MKLERLLSIIILLLNRRMVQAKELAERFEVSTRTIYRDIEAINMAGIPVVTYQGTNGGIGLAEGYRLDRNVLTNDELAAIVTALRSISTSYGEEYYQHLAEKMNSVVRPNEAEAFQEKTSRILIDYSPWDGQDRLQAKLDLLKKAVDHCQVARFVYSNAQGEVTKRTIEPHTLILKGQHWYIQAYCLTREQFRLFKLNRMKELVIKVDTSFTRRSIPAEQNITGKSKPQTTAIVLRFEAQVRHLAEDWFGVEELTETTDGAWQVTKHYPEDEWLYGFILSLGPHVQVIEPFHIREIIAERATRIAQLYQD